MICSKVRDDLLQGSTTAASRRHLEECPACARFKERFEQTTAELGAHHLTVVPDRTFVARVVARLPVPEPPLGWAAVRILPAAAALLVVLSAWVWVGTATPSELVAWSPTDDLVGWVLGHGETEE